MLYFTCKNLAINIRDCVFLVGRGGGSVAGAPVRNLGEYVYPHCLSFGRDIKSNWSLLSGFYATGSNVSYTGVNV